ncbi:DUF1559 domain-containing protein [Thalassoglobus sp.]|uniref:DUF1559 family PulG-like putative transporter n=1 Tax=Thalassoglobus sp. TaxID=2795869 RepID=UPI003AA8A15C
MSARYIVKRKHGFTLIELLVVMAVIGILVALLLPAVQSTREAARRTRCQSRLRQIALSLHNYHEAHSTLPIGSMTVGPSFIPFSGWGWAAMALPYFDQAPLYNKIDFSTNNAVGPNAPLGKTILPFLICPSDPSPSQVYVRNPLGGGIDIATGNYLGVESMLRELESVKFAQVTDGLSSTFFLSEHAYQYQEIFDFHVTSSWVGTVSFANEWVSNSVPHQEAVFVKPINDSVFSSHHFGGAYFALGDGHVRFFSENMDLGVYSALGTENGGEAVSF